MRLRVILLLSSLSLPLPVFAETDPADVAAKEERRKKNEQETDKAGKEIVKDIKR